MLVLVIDKFDEKYLKAILPKFFIVPFLYRTVIFRL